jgi:DNA-directed RNA polymerase subunit RPC12/RpoP
MSRPLPSEGRGQKFESSRARQFCGTLRSAEAAFYVEPRSAGSIAMSKEAMRAEAERLVKEAMERNIQVKTGNTRIETKCGKCGAPNRVSAEPGQTRVKFSCKECGHKQQTL